MAGLFALAVVMFVAALLCFLVETVTPHGVMGALGGLLAVGAAFLIYKATGDSIETGVLAFVFIALVSVVILVLGFKYMPDSPVGRLLILKGSETREAGYSAAADERFENLIGQEGIADSYLRPTGIGEFGNVRVDVISEGEFIPKGSRIKVTDVSGNRVIVRLV